MSLGGGSKTACARRGPARPRAPGCRRLAWGSLWGSDVAGAPLPRGVEFKASAWLRGRRDAIAIDGGGAASGATAGVKSGTIARNGTRAGRGGVGGLRLGRVQHRPDSTFGVEVKPDGDGKGGKMGTPPSVPCPFLPEPSCGRIVPACRGAGSAARRKRRRRRLCRMGVTELAPIPTAEPGRQGGCFVPNPRGPRGPPRVWWVPVSRAGLGRKQLGSPNPP